ncbi:MAG: BMP family ABC transporter substrate-binding protein, partial [Dehalococcoidales bacterium]|nr:BMP family ABC transporter substrate-binding protein [Dehalococcoidales bacterium]
MKCNHHAMRRFFTLILILIMTAVFLLPAGCTGTHSDSNQQTVLNVGLLLGSGGLGDKSFNDSAYNGLLQAQKLYNVRFETVDFTEAAAKLDALRLFARNNYDLIIGVAYENKTVIETVAAEYPGIRFAAIDFEANGPNIASIVYREQEADFLVGVLAAMLTKTKIVGVIGGTDIPAIRRIMSGFQQGVAYQDTNVRFFAR